MKNIVLLLIGFIAGTVLALFFAPESGEVLRSQLGVEAQAERQKIDAEVQRSLTRIHDRVEAVHTELTGHIQEIQNETSRFGEWIAPAWCGESAPNHAGLALAAN